MGKIYKWYLQNRLTKRKEKKAVAAKNKLPALAKDEFDYIQEFESRHNSGVYREADPSNQRTRDAVTQTESEPGTNRPVSGSHSPKFSVRPTRGMSPVYMSSARRAKSRNSSNKSPMVSHTAKSADTKSEVTSGEKKDDADGSINEAATLENEGKVLGVSNAPPATPNDVVSPPSKLNANLKSISN
jgi:hypothetical protein